MSVENRIFWLLVGILALYIVFSVTGRAAVQRFIREVFGSSGSGGGSGGGSTPAPAPSDPGRRGDSPPPGWTQPGGALA